MLILDLRADNYDFKKDIEARYSIVSGIKDDFCGRAREVGVAALGKEQVGRAPASSSTSRRSGITRMIFVTHVDALHNSSLFPPALYYQKGLL